jgi:hypothetical protein
MPSNRPGFSGEQIQASFPQYYNGRVCRVAGRGVEFPPNANNCNVVTPGIRCLLSVGDWNNGGWFVATATGCIRTGCQRANSPIAGGNPRADQNGFLEGPAPPVGIGIRQDAWAIDHRRQLRRWSDGGS